MTLDMEMSVVSSRPFALPNSWIKLLYHYDYMLKYRDKLRKHGSVD
jgi:hypothetical protein